MELLWLRIVLPIAVALVLSLYLYDAGANRVYDVIISAVGVIALSPLIAVLCVVCAVKNKRLFDVAEDDLLFTYPDNVLGTIPRLFLVFIGKKRIMPEKLKKMKSEE